MGAPNRRRTPTRNTGGRVFRVALVLAVLAGTFGGGFLAGRHLERKAAAARVVHDPDAPGDAPNGATMRARGRSAAADPTLPRIQEKLTFYQTLTAPLDGGPTRERAAGGKTDAKPPSPRPAVVAPAPPTGAAAAPVATGEAATAYTIQVAAYRTLAQAEALRAKLGSEAYVVEGATDSGTAFRVRIGTFTSRAEAEAVRVERALGGFITPR